MVQMDKFKGIFVAFNSCFDDEGHVSLERTKVLAKFYEDKGIKGLYVCGSSGEGFVMTVEERKETLKAVVEAVGGKLTIIAHIGANNTEQSIELAQHAEEVGADAIASVPPVIYRVKEGAIKKYWEEIVASTTLPFVIYNMPAFTGYDVSSQLLEEMVQNPQIIGIKNTTMNAYQIQQFKRIGGENFIVFNGPDEQYLAGRVMGADAGIGGTYGIMPELFVKLERCIADNDWMEAQKWQIRINEIITDILRLPSLWAGTKQILKLRGVDAGAPRRPLQDARAEDMPFINEIYKKLVNYIEMI